MDKKTRDKAYAKEWRKNNQDKVKAYNKMRYERDIDKIKAYQDKFRDELRFDGQSEEVFERDNWECQECGMSQEQSIILFNRKLYIHHKDGMGSGSSNINNDINNLITLCPRCHGRIHRKIYFEERWGDLIKQDDSKWKYPKIRELVNSKINKEVNISNAKKIVAEELNVSYWTIDGHYYEKKEKHDGY
jgi:5-methylcytosine-specific restriction endonuclease McrA